MSDPEFLTVLRAGRPEHTPEVEGVLVQTTPREAVVTLNDGETLTFDLAELRAALDEPQGHMKAAA